MAYQIISKKILRQSFEADLTPGAFRRLTSDLVPPHEIVRLGKLIGPLDKMDDAAWRNVWVAFNKTTDSLLLTLGELRCLVSDRLGWGAGPHACPVCRIDDAAGVVCGGCGSYYHLECHTGQLVPHHHDRVPIYGPCCDDE